MTERWAFRRWFRRIDRGYIRVLLDSREVGDLDVATVSMVVDACAARKVTARDAATTLLTLATGIRNCEIIALRQADVD